MSNQRNYKIGQGGAVMASVIHFQPDRLPSRAGQPAPRSIAARPAVVSLQQQGIYSRQVPSRSLVGRAFYCVANLLGLAAWFAGLIAVTYIVGALMSVPTRTLERWDGTSYSRTQRELEIESHNAGPGRQRN